MMSTWSRLFFCAESLQRGGNLLPLRRVVIHQIGDLQDLSVGGFHELKTRLRVGALPLAQFLDDVLDLA